MIGQDFLTIDGRTSNGGIVIRGAQTSLKADQIILRYLRFRPGHTAPQGDALTALRRKNIIIDHCSLSWANDEVGSFYNNENFTLQYTLLSESLHDAGHAKGEHGYAAIWGGKRASFLRNVIANHSSRTPRINGYRLRTPYPQSEGLVDIRNNLIFNWGYNSVYGAEGANFDLVNNVFKAGPASTAEWIFQLWQRPDVTQGRAYIHGNQITGDPSGSTNNRLRLSVKDKKAAEAERILDDLLVTSALNNDNSASFTLTTEQVYQLLIIEQNVGANLPFQDSVDKRVLRQIVRPPVNTNGLIDSELEVIDSWQDYALEFTGR